jgi:hypothetical protein
MKIYFPLKYSENIKLEFMYDLIFKKINKNLKNLRFLSSFKLFIKKNSFLEINELIRLFFSRNSYIKIFFSSLKEFLKNYVNKNQFFSFYDCIFLIETVIKNCGQNEIFFEYLFFLFDYLYKKKFFHLSSFLLFKLENERKEKNYFFKILIRKLNIFTKQREFKAANNCLNFLLIFFEKENFGRNFNKKIFSRAAQLAIKENRMVVAFSFFFELFSKNSLLNKIKNSWFFEWLIFCSIFLKKQKMNMICKNHFFQYNNLNFIFLEILNESISKKNFLVLETILKEKVWYDSTQTMEFFIRKKYKILILMSIMKIIKSFLRISIREISLIIGISERKLKRIFSKKILSGNLKGFLSEEFEFFLNLNNFKNFSYFLLLTDISLCIDKFLTKIL